MISFELGKEIGGWRTASGNYDFSGKQVFNMGDDLVDKGVAIILGLECFNYKEWFP
ncbi:hypothetical protein [Aureispira anguillae]|uniref:Uncharacterized protein n=1 Tax=Aureispira anguillae TaxID=2864201 RepID=A0A915YF83_9BACT|nr:hypothetical protein [Aureispira anguillae]BDS11947.1 hypothetical protein AsAng_0026620 [Aureispira anguillae]